MKKDKSGNSLIRVTATALLRRGSSFLLAAIVLIGCFTAIVLNRLTQKQEEARDEMVRTSVINCIVSDAQGMNMNQLSFPKDMYRRLTGENENKEENLDDYVRDVNAMWSEELSEPSGMSLSAISSFAADPALAEVEGVEIQMYAGFDESIFRTEEQVCLVPDTRLAEFPSGIVRVTLWQTIVVELDIVGTVSNGAGSTLYVPLDMYWGDGVRVSKNVNSCIFNIRDNARLDETKAALYDVFVEPKLSNDLLGGKFGLIIQDEAYQATLDGINANLIVLRTLLPVLMVLVGAIGFFASYMTTRGRVKEFGVMRCLGMTRGRIFWLVFFEQLVLALVGGVLGIILGVIFDGAIEAGAMLRALAVIVMFLIGSAIAAVRVTKVNVMTLMKEED